MTRSHSIPWLAVLLAGCVAVTINVQFPQEKIDSAASNIEDLVRTPKDAPIEPAPTSPRSEGGTRLISLFGPRSSKRRPCPTSKRARRRSSR